MKQSGRIRLCLLGPLLCGCVIIALSSWMPVFLQYSVWVDRAIADIINEELKVLGDVSYHLAAHSGYYMQTPANFLLLISTLVKNFYAGSLQISQTFLQFQNSNYCVNAIQEAQRNISGNDISLSMWYLGPTVTEYSQLSEESKTHLKDSVIFDSFVRPTIASSNPARAWQMWTAYDSDGLVYVTPAASYNFWLNFTEEASCIYNQGRSPQYDARCRKWYQQTKQCSMHYIPIVTETYAAVHVQELTQSVCKGIWLTGQLNQVVCIDYSVSLLLQMFTNLTTGGDSYAFALTATGAVFAHPAAFHLGAGVQQLHLA